MALGPALVATKSYSHPDIGRTYARARELCRQLGDHSREFTALRGLQLHHMNLLEMEKAQHLAEEALRVAERLDDAAHLVGAHVMLATPLYLQGKLESALPHYRRALASSRCPQLIEGPIRVAEHPGNQHREAVALHAGMGTTDYAAGALRMCEEQRNAQFHAIALCANGWALTASGESEKGLAQIEQAVESYGLGMSQNILLALQAHAQLAIGKPEAALASAAAGLRAVEKLGGAPLEAELHRLKGEALLADAGTVIEAETAMQQGIDVARRQNAKSWELRGAMSLARLRRQQGRPQEAAALLAPILGWFTEGFDTIDLKEAKTLLDELTAPAIAAEG
jgi:tetratricopeptide (TPR) repeat protein